MKKSLTIALMFFALIVIVVPVQGSDRYSVSDNLDSAFIIKKTEWSTVDYYYVQADRGEEDLLNRLNLGDINGLIKIGAYPGTIDQDEPVLMRLLEKETVVFIDNNFTVMDNRDLHRAVIWQPSFGVKFEKILPTESFTDIRVELVGQILTFFIAEATGSIEYRFCLDREERLYSGQIDKKMIVVQKVAIDYQVNDQSYFFIEDYLCLENSAGGKKELFIEEDYATMTESDIVAATLRNSSNYNEGELVYLKEETNLVSGDYNCRLVNVFYAGDQLSEFQIEAQTGIVCLTKKAEIFWQGENLYVISFSGGKYDYSFKSCCREFQALANPDAHLIPKITVAKIDTNSGENAIIFEAVLPGEEDLEAFRVKSIREENNSLNLKLDFRGDEIYYYRKY